MCVYVCVFMPDIFKGIYKHVTDSVFLLLGYFCSGTHNEASICYYLSVSVIRIFDFKN